MTAKPQPMAGQSQAPDDLIAELAKLMAQDAQDTPAAKPAEQSPFTVRIPGEPANAAAPRQNEPVRIPQAAPSQPQQPAAPRAAEPVRQEPTPPAQPAPPPSQPNDPADPFAFAFNLGARREPAAPAQPVPPPAPVAAQPAAPITVQPAAPEQPVEDFGHDSIADLIAAELAMDSQPAPKPVQAAAPAPEKAPEQPQPVPNDGWAPVNTAPNLAGQERSAQPQPRPTNPQPAPRQEAPRAEQDKFRIPPVFGLGTTPAARPAEARAPEPARVEPSTVPVEPGFARAPAQPAPTPDIETPPAASRETIVSDDNVGLDPIDEIESLIGRAMRVGFERPEAQPEEPEQRPAPRSLATPQLPKQSAPSPRSVSSADEAILAAAQASGAEIGWVDAPEPVQAAPRRKRERRQFAMPRIGFSRAVAGPLIAVTLLLAAGFGLYWVLGLGGSAQDGPPPLLTADATPVKETPPAQPDAAADQSIVFNEINGVVPGAEEQLLSRDQADVNEVTQAAAAPDVSAEGLANRKVRTVTVRPDGTIVSGDNSLAGSTILPVDRPNVPAVPGAETASPELLASTSPDATVPPAANAPAADPAALPATDPTATPAPDAAAIPPAAPETPAPAASPATPGATVPAVDATGNPLPGKTAVIPLQRPTTFRPQPLASAEPTSPVNAVIQTEPAPAAQASVAVPGATEVEALSNDAPAYVQLASQRTEADARTTAQRLVSRFGPLFGGANMEVQRVDLGSRGIFYRVRVPANSLQEASTMCNNVKAAGGDCFTM